MIMNMKQSKPFNPILGETFQCHIGPHPVYMEQISHHPPVTSFYVPSKNFKLYGNYMPEANISMNSLNCIYHGLTHIHLHNNNKQNNCDTNNDSKFDSDNSSVDKYVFVFPNFQIHNTAFGERYFNYTNKAFLVH